MSFSNIFQQLIRTKTIKPLTQILDTKVEENKNFAKASNNDLPVGEITKEEKPKEIAKKEPKSFVIPPIDQNILNITAAADKKKKNNVSKKNKKDNIQLERNVKLYNDAIDTAAANLIREQSIKRSILSLKTNYFKKKD